MQRKFDSRRSWSDLAHFGVEWAQAATSGQPTRARCAPNARQEDRACPEKALCVHQKRHARVGCALRVSDGLVCARVHPDGPTVRPLLQKSVFWFFLAAFLLQLVSNHLKTLYNFTKPFHYDMCDFKHLLAKISLFNFDPVCLKSYDLVQNFNLT